MSVKSFLAILTFKNPVVIVLFTRKSSGESPEVLKKIREERKMELMYTGYELVWLFFVSSFVGWCLETVSAAVGQKRLAADAG